MGTATFHGCPHRAQQVGDGRITSRSHWSHRSRPGTPQAAHVVGRMNSRSVFSTSRTVPEHSSHVCVTTEHLRVNFTFTYTQRRSIEGTSQMSSGQVAVSLKRTRSAKWPRGRGDVEGPKRHRRTRTFPVVKQSEVAGPQPNSAKWPIGRPLLSAEYASAVRMRRPQVTRCANQPIGQLADCSPHSWCGGQAFW